MQRKPLDAAGLLQTCGRAVADLAARAMVAGRSLVPLSPVIFLVELSGLAPNNHVQRNMLF